jgi:hypothetical protein
MTHREKMDLEWKVRYLLGGHTPELDIIKQLLKLGFNRPIIKKYITAFRDNQTHGGKRPNSGRKPGFKMPKKKLKEKTKVMRIPVSLVTAVKKLIKDHSHPSP